jgi:hypothetical protein
MHTCPSCLALLRPDPDVVDRELAAALAAGRRLHRPVDRVPFAGGLCCTVTRATANGGLVVCGVEGFIEANVTGADRRARPPLTCHSEGLVAFRLVPYRAVPNAVVAIDGDGAPLGTYLSAGDVLDRSIDVRDETSAPVARLRFLGAGAHDAGLELIETGGRLLATGSVEDVERDDWIDDEWTLTAHESPVPLQLWAFVALVVAAKVLVGRPSPVRAPERLVYDDAETLAETLFRDD